MIKKIQIMGVVAALIVIALSFVFFRGTNIFYFILGIALFIGGLPFFLSLILETKTEREKERMFLEFSRDLAEGVKTGTPISQSILNIRKKNYGVLNPHIGKLANQISLGIPIQIAFETFARDAGTRIIKRSITVISESEKAGGQIEDILDSVVKSVSQSEKLRKERRAAMYSLVVQGYIIFFIFIVIMLVMQFKVLPITEALGTGLGSADTSGIGGSFGNLLGGGGATSEELAKPFIWLLVVQGFFAGLVIGKLSEGRIRSGFKHSFILVLLALWIDASAKLFFGGIG